jgi:hypothetical protein
VLWHQGLRDIANTYVSKIGDSARLFALVSLAMADAGIATWDAKRHYVFWRPVTAIQEGDNDGNPRPLQFGMAAADQQPHRILSTRREQTG